MGEPSWARNASQFKSKGSFSIARPSGRRARANKLRKFVGRRGLVSKACSTKRQTAEDLARGHWGQQARCIETRRRARGSAKSPGRPAPSTNRPCMSCAYPAACTDPMVSADLLACEDPMGCAGPMARFDPVTFAESVACLDPLACVDIELCADPSPFAVRMAYARPGPWSGRRGVRRPRGMRRLHSLPRTGRRACAEQGPSLGRRRIHGTDRANVVACSEPMVALCLMACTVSHGLRRPYGLRRTHGCTDVHGLRPFPSSSLQ